MIFYSYTSDFLFSRIHRVNHGESIAVSNSSLGMSFLAWLVVSTRVTAYFVLLHSQNTKCSRPVGIVPQVQIRYAHKYCWTRLAANSARKALFATLRRALPTRTGRRAGGRADTYKNSLYKLCLSSRVTNYKYLLRSNSSKCSRPRLAAYRPRKGRYATLRLGQMPHLPLGRC